MLTHNINLGIIVYVVSSLRSEKQKVSTSKVNDNTAWLLGQAVKTPPFHGGNRGSIPLGVTIYTILWAHSSAGRAPALQAGGHRFEPCCAHHKAKNHMREWYSGSTSPCQGECREFESRLPLQMKPSQISNLRGLNQSNTAP